MYVSGDWLEREMENATEYKANLKMIRTPVTSDLAEKSNATAAYRSARTPKKKTLRCLRQ